MNPRHKGEASERKSDDRRLLLHWGGEEQNFFLSQEKWLIILHLFNELCF